jgi:hypothetical protein
MRAADLQVTDGEIVWRWDDRLRLCPTNWGCAWLFLDLSKNRSRLVQHGRLRWPGEGGPTPDRRPARNSMPRRTLAYTM